MAKENLSKNDIQYIINKKFQKSLTKKEIKRLEKLAMSKNIKLKSLRKKYCKKCYSFFDPNNSEIRIKNKFKIIKCKKCENISRWKIKD